MNYNKTKHNGKRIRVHRLVMQEYLGRELGRFEIVHHKDGNKHNNELSNLELLTHLDHNRKHAKYEREQTCFICQKIFIPKCGYGYPSQKTCSRECGWDLRRLKSQVLVES